MVELRGVSKVYVPRPGGRAIQALTDVSFQVAAGELVVLSGPTGCGKSTVLRLLCGEERASQGAILVNGEDVGALPRRGVARLRRRLGVVPQEARLLGDRTVFGNVAVVLRALGASRRDARARALAALREAGLAGRANAFPRELAAGERQRLLVARALAGVPALLLADEPLMAFGGALDGPAAQEVFDLLRGAQARGATVLVATQAAGLADALKARPVFLDGGRVRASGNGGPGGGAP